MKLIMRPRSIFLLLCFHLFVVYQGNAQERITLKDAFQQYSYRGLGFGFDLGYRAECPIGDASEFYATSHGFTLQPTVLYNRWTVGLGFRCMWPGFRLRKDFAYHLDIKNGEEVVTFNEGTRMSGGELVGLIKYDLLEKQNYSAGPFLAIGNGGYYPLNIEEEYSDAIVEKTSGPYYELGIQLALKHLLFVFDSDQLQGTSLLLSLSAAKNKCPALNNWSVNISLLYAFRARAVIQKGN